jgi:hypothetical protein
MSNPRSPWPLDVIAGAIGLRLVSQAERVGNEDGGGWRRITALGHAVEMTADEQAVSTA